MLLLLGLQEFPEQAVCTGVLPSLGMQSAALLVSAAAKRQWQVLGKVQDLGGAGDCQSAFTLKSACQMFAPAAQGGGAACHPGTFVVQWVVLVDMKGKLWSP